MHAQPITGLSLGGVVTALLGFLGRLGWKTLQHDRRLLADIHEELTVQRANCLATISDKASTTNTLLQGVNDKLGELNGFLRGFLEGHSK